jgi:hypothetical protein
MLQCRCCGIQVEQRRGGEQGDGEVKGGQEMMQRSIMHNSFDFFCFNETSRETRRKRTLFPKNKIKIQGTSSEEIYTPHVSSPVDTPLHKK